MEYSRNFIGRLGALLLALAINGIIVIIVMYLFVSEKYYNKGS